MELNDIEKGLRKVIRDLNESNVKSPEEKEEIERKIDQALETIIRQGRSQEFKDVLKAHQFATYTIHKDGNLAVQAVIGKRLLRRYETVFQLQDVQPPSYASHIKQYRDLLLGVLSKWKEFDDSIMFDANMNGRDILELNKERFEIDSKLYLAAKMLSQCEVHFSNNSSLDDKLYAAEELGRLTTRYSTLIEEGLKQKKVAKQPRKSTLNCIIENLAKREGTAKELWLAFFGELDDNGLSPIECTKELKYSYKNPDGKDQSIKFKTFENKLSALRKDNLSK